MSKRAFLALITGLLATTLLVGALLVYRDHRDTRVEATGAKLQSSRYGIGAEYTGVLTEQHVEKGQFVRKGQLLGKLKSGSLIERMAEAGISTADIPYQLDAQKNIELRASGDGTVHEINYIQGSFVPANQRVYEIITADQYFVLATFNRLSRAQVNRLTPDKTVMLAYKDGSSMPARIRSISIEQADTTTYNVELEVVPASQPNPKDVVIGEPLDAQLVLQEKSFYTRLAAIVEDVKDTVLRR